MFLNGGFCLPKQSISWVTIGTFVVSFFFLYFVAMRVLCASLAYTWSLVSFCLSSCSFSLFFFLLFWLLLVTSGHCTLEGARERGGEGGGGGEGYIAVKKFDVMGLRAREKPNLCGGGKGMLKTGFLEA